MRPTSVAIILVVLSLLATLPAPAAAADYTVLIGWETLVDQYGLAWYSLFFYPQDLTIAYGDSVTWVWNSRDEHNVVFSGADILSATNVDGTLNPIAGEVGNQTHFIDPTALYSSGLRNGFVAPVTLTFTPNDGGGTYPYYCSIHASSGMIANLTVLPEGQLAPLTPEQINATIDGLIAGLEAFATQEIAAIEAAAPATGPGVTHTQLADGTNEWTVIGGAMFMNGNESMYARFLPSYIEINLNDTITWIVNGGDPHYVYFQIDNDWPYFYTNWSPTQSTPISANLSNVSSAYSVNPIIDPTTGAPTTSLPTALYPNPTGTVNSGVLFAEMYAGVLPFPNSYSVKFVETGTFDY